LKNWGETGKYYDNSWYPYNDWRNFVKKFVTGKNWNKHYFKTKKIGGEFFFKIQNDAYYDCMKRINYLVIGFR